MKQVSIASRYSIDLFELIKKAKDHISHILIINNSMNHDSIDFFEYVESDKHGAPYCFTFWPTWVTGKIMHAQR